MGASHRKGLPRASLLFTIGLWFVSPGSGLAAPSSGLARSAALVQDTAAQAASAQARTTQQNASQAGAPTEAPDSAAQPNVVFFLADDLRFDQLGCCGHPVLQTPHVDRLAAEGVRFTEAFVTTSICAASRASILTGHPERFTISTFGTPPLRDALVQASYPVRLRAAGYRTGFVGKLGVRMPQGATKAMFDVFQPMGRGPYFKPQPDGSTRHTTQILADRAEDFLASQDPGTPFCLSLSFNAPHAEDGDKKDHFPWPKVMDGMYEDVVPGPPRLGDPAEFEIQPEFLKQSMNRDRWHWRWDTEEKWQRNVRAYWRMVSGVDHAVGRVLAALEQRGLAENTVVVFTSDNGYYMGDRGFAGKWSHYEESLRIPMVVFDPRLPAERRGVLCEATALNLDLPATFLDLAGLDAPDMAGRSLRPLLDGTTPADWRTDFLCEHRFNNASIPKWEGVRAFPYTYARYYEQDPPFEFLFDLELDPFQRENVVTDPTYTEILEQLRARCDALLEQHAPPDQG